MVCGAIAGETNGGSHGLDEDIPEGNSLVRVRGIEPRFQAWEAHVIAVILHPQLADVPSTRRLRTVKPYDYQDAASLIADFWSTVDAVLRDRGVIP